MSAYRAKPQPTKLEWIGGDVPTATRPSPLTPAPCHPLRMHAHDYRASFPLCSSVVRNLPNPLKNRQKVASRLANPLGTG